MRVPRSRLPHWMGVLVIVCLLTITSGCAGRSPETVGTSTTQQESITGPRPVVLGAVPNGVVQHRWREFSDTSGHGGWAAADGTHSARLTDGRLIWLFGDTFLGPVRDDESLPEDSPLVHNSAVLTAGEHSKTLLGGGAGHPASLIGPTPSGASRNADHREAYWYWTRDGIATGKKLQVFVGKQVSTDKAGPFNFRSMGTGIATFSLPNLHLEQVTPTYSAGGIRWGVNLFRQGGYIYIAGVENADGTKYLHLARARSGALHSSWQFATGSGWAADPSASARLLDNVGSTVGLAPVSGGYVLVTTGSQLGSPIYAYTAATPAGPFRGRRRVYQPPENSDHTYAYNVSVHPALTTPGHLVISYNVNSTDVNDVYDNVRNYRPRFLTLTLGPFQ